MSAYVKTTTENFEIGPEPVYIGLHGDQRKIVLNAGGGDLHFSYTGPFNEPLLLHTSDRATITRPVHAWSAHTRVQVTTEEPKR